MNNIEVEGINIFYDTNGKPFVDICRKTCEKGISLIQKMWGLEVPKNYQIYLTSHWWKFSFRLAPWYEILLFVIFPLIFIICNSRDWRTDAGWTFMNRLISGINTSPIVLSSKNTIGKMIFKPESSLERELEIAIIHEMVHAFTQNKLPPSLYEGVAMYTQDIFIGHTTGREETINILGGLQCKRRKLPYRDFNKQNDKNPINKYIRSYWLTKLLEDQTPGFIKSILGTTSIDDQICDHLNIPRKNSRCEIDRLLVNQFGKEYITKPILGSNGFR
jgi:hypothetical protein